MIPIATQPVSEATGIVSKHAYDLAHHMRPGVLQLSALPPLSLYVHLPWCLRKCPYCDFNSHATPEGVLPERAYADALIADLEVSLPLIWGRPVHTVFFGGGTPSLFSPETMNDLIAAIRARVRLDPDAEITLEANPGTFEKDRFRAFAQSGVTRLSVGVQSFNDTHLGALGRVHDSAQALAAVQEAARSFKTFNIDLMYALPGQTLADLDRDIDQALDCGTPHLSIYHLTVEPNTYFAKYPPVLPHEDLAYAMLDRLSERTVQAGMERYEVSAFARPGHRCRHNLNYWQFGDYLGLGAGAHSKISFAHRVVRQVRYRDPRLYMEHALKGQPLSSSQEVRRAELPFEFMLNALRLPEGFLIQDFMDRTGMPLSSIASRLQEAERRGLLVLDHQSARPSAQGFDFLSDLQALFLEEV
jgi:oxygen-independent coproporphyrinogen-3 oxidase